MRMDLPALTTLLVTLRLSGVAQGTPMEAFRGNIAAIQARDRAAYLCYYLHTPEPAGVAPAGPRLGYAESAPGPVQAQRGRVVDREPGLTGQSAYVARQRRR